MMFIDLTRRSDGKKIKVSKHAIGYMEEVGIIEWKKESLFNKGEWVEDTTDKFTELNIFGKTIFVDETIQEIEEMMNEKPIKEGNKLSNRARRLGRPLEQGGLMSAT